MNRIKKRGARSPRVPFTSGASSSASLLSSKPFSQAESPFDHLLPRTKIVVSIEATFPSLHSASAVAYDNRFSFPFPGEEEAIVTPSLTTSLYAESEWQQKNNGGNGNGNSSRLTLAQSPPNTAGSALPQSPPHTHTRDTRIHTQDAQIYAHASASDDVTAGSTMGGGDGISVCLWKKAFARKVDEDLLYTLEALQLDLTVEERSVRVEPGSLVELQGGLPVPTSNTAKDRRRRWGSMGMNECMSEWMDGWMDGKGNEGADQ